MSTIVESSNDIPIPSKPSSSDSLVVVVGGEPVEELVQKLDSVCIDAPHSSNLVSQSQSPADTIKSAKDAVNTSDQPPPTPPSSPQPLKLVIDVSHGFPLQRRPRRERINAVSNQIINFLASLDSWGGREKKGLVQVMVGGSAGNWEGDAGEVKKRLGEVGGIELVERIVWGTTSEDVPRGDSSVYLSPDAEEPLDVGEGEGWRYDYIIVGGLVDRAVTPGRSLKKAASFGVAAAQLPLASLNLEELVSTEALNIDTVLEMCGMWKLNVAGGEGVGEGWRKAATKAMLLHEERHPNRRLHGDGKKRR